MASLLPHLFLGSASLHKILKVDKIAQADLCLSEAFFSRRVGLATHPFHHNQQKGG